MSECGESETVSLTNSSQFRVKYGSTSRHVVSNCKERYISHVVQPTDTLQGLALKYQVTMEQIKRANKLWSSDSLTLRSRQMLYIPIPIEGSLTVSPLYSSSTEDTSCANANTISLDETHRGINRSHMNEIGNTSSSLESDEITLDMQDSDIFQHKLTNGCKTKRTSNSPSIPISLVSSSHDADSDDESAADFLIRIDSSIAVSKDKVRKHTCLEHDMASTISGTHSDDDLFRYQKHAHKHDHHDHGNGNNSGLRRHNSSSSPRSRSTHNCSHSDSVHYENGQPFVVMTQGRKVKSSLKRLEKTQDELFEL